MDCPEGKKVWLGRGNSDTWLRGFWCPSRVHTAKILRLSSDLPIIIEIVDTHEKIENFLPVIDDAIKEGLTTLENVRIRLYRSGESE
jgi:PII-like signaling protein